MLIANCTIPKMLLQYDIQFLSVLIYLKWQISETKHLNIKYVRYSLNLLLIIVIRKHFSVLGLLLVSFDLTYLHEQKLNFLIFIEEYAKTEWN